MGLRNDQCVRRAFSRSAAMFGVVLLASLAAAQESATTTSEETVQTLHRGLIDSARAPDASLEQRYRSLQPVIAATHDLQYIAEFSLRRQWPTLSDEDRQRFVEAFERLSVMTYVSRFSGVGDQTFKMTGATPTDGGRVTVAAVIRRADGGEIPLEYLLHQRDGRWQIINIIADGVSDLALKRAEYQRVLTDRSIDGLIAHIDEQTARLQ